ncbi:dehydrogenase [Paenibacillus marinisediminis]
MLKPNERHASPLPSVRKIRRSCQNELYRTVKRMKVYISEDLLKQGEQLYTKKVIGNLMWIHENSNNRKLLADWFDEAVSEDLAELWQVDRVQLSGHFRHTFGG